MKQIESKKRRRRTCADRLRHHLAEWQRHRRGNDPAGKVLLHLLGLLSGALVFLPPLPPLSFASGRLLGTAGPVPLSDSRPRSGQRADIDCIDDEGHGPTCYAMERGIEPVFYRLSSRAAPTWSRLVKNLKRHQTKDRASLLLEYRVPPDAVLWLREMIHQEDWAALLRLGRDGASDDMIAAGALAEAKRWEATLDRTAADPAPAADDDAGAAAPPAGPKPKA